MSGLFEIKYSVIGDKLKLYSNFLGIKFSSTLARYVDFYWQEPFSSYLKRNDRKLKTKLLKKGMDKVSKEYIGHFLSLIPYWNHFNPNIWTKYDIKTKRRNEKFLTTFKQPYPEILNINPYFYSNIYGLIDLPKKVFDKINGKIIIDGGGLNGDTALMFNHYFPISPIYIFEPLSININKIRQIILINNHNDKLVPIQKALGNKEEFIEITFNDKELAQVTTIDTEFKFLEEKVGLIKLDTEGFETKIIEGALEIIKRDKPILAVAIYHTPEDFFELKTKIENLNLGYKFMIRRSEMVLPQADLVLIAY